MSYIKFLKSEFEDLKLDCDFWDVRIEDTVETVIVSEKNEIISCAVNPSLGVFLRVRKKGFWLYQSTTQIKDLKKILIELAQTEAPEKIENFKYQHPKSEPYINVAYAEKRFSDVAIDDKIQLILDYSKFSSKQPNINVVRTQYKDIFKLKSYINSVGTYFEYDFNQAGMTMSLNLKRGDSIFDDYYRMYGSQFSDMQNHHEKMEVHIQESQAFLDAPTIKPGKYKVLLNPDGAGVFTHESFGHRSEADFMLGDESALKDWQIGKKIASESLTIIDQGHFEGTSGYCPIDDEGISCQKNYLIKDGVLAGRLHSVETAHILNESATGNGRAINFEYEPIVRMTSTYIEAGKEPLEDILKKSNGALMIQDYKHGSGLSTFTIAPVRGYMIGENGQKSPVRVSVISGNVFETLKNIEAVSSTKDIISYATGGCGKGEQWPLSVASGGPYVLVKEMQVS